MNFLLDILPGTSFHSWLTVRKDKWKSIPPTEEMSSADTYNCTLM